MSPFSPSSMIALFQVNQYHDDWESEDDRAVTTDKLSGCRAWDREVKNGCCEKTLFVLVLSRKNRITFSSDDLKYGNSL